MPHRRARAAFVDRFPRDAVAQRRRREPDDLAEIAQHGSLVDLRAHAIGDGEQRSDLDQHVPVAIRVTIATGDRQHAHHPGVHAPDEAGRIDGEVLLGRHRHPRLVRSRSHLAPLLEADRRRARAPDRSRHLEPSPHRGGQLLESWAATTAAEPPALASRARASSSIRCWNCRVAAAISAQTAANRDQEPENDPHDPRKCNSCARGRGPSILPKPSRFAQNLARRPQLPRGPTRTSPT